MYLIPQVDRTDRLPKVQFLLNINEGKRASLEQKMFKDMLLGGGLGEALGGGGGGGLGGIMDAFNGSRLDMCMYICMYVWNA